MGKKKKQNKETTIENYYDLKTEQIDDLVSVLKGDNYEEKTVSTNIGDCTDGAETGKDKNKEFNPYKLDKLSGIPTWIKAFVIKAWSAGMVCYLFLWGLQSFISDSVLLALVDGAVMGVIVDIFVNPAMRYLQSDEKEFDWYMMFPFPFKKYWTLFANIIYYIIVNIGIVYIYLFVGTFISDSIGVEPLLFGLFNFLVDMIFIGIKDLIVYLIRKSKKKKREMADV